MTNKRKKVSGKKVSRKVSGKVSGKGNSLPRHQYVEVFKQIVPLLAALAVLDTRPDDEGYADMGISVWQSIAQDLGQHLTPEEQEAALGRADMLLGVMLATEGEA